MTSTPPGPVLPPPPPPVRSPEPLPRPNRDDAWWRAGLCGALAMFLGVVTLVVLRHPDPVGSFEFGQITSWVGLPVGLLLVSVGLLAHGSAKRWRRRSYVISILGGTAVLVAGLEATSVMRAEVEARGGVARALQGEASDRTLVEPGEITGWRVVERGAARRQVEASYERTLAYMGGAGGTHGLYRGPGGAQMTFVGIEIEPGTEAAQEFARSQSSAALNIVAGTGADEIEPGDPGRLGGELSCGEQEVQGYPYTTCAWIDSQTIGVVHLNTGDGTPMDRDEAVAHVQALREAATRED